MTSLCAAAAETRVLEAASVGVAGTPEHTRQAALPGFGPGMDAVIVAEIGGVNRGCGAGLAVLPGRADAHRVSPRPGSPWAPTVLAGADLTRRFGRDSPTPAMLVRWQDNCLRVRGTAYMTDFRRSEQGEPESACR